MNIKTILSECLKYQVFLSVKESKLRVVFEGEKIDDNLLSEIKKNKDKLLDYLDSKQDNTNFPIVQAKEEDSYPLSFSQQRLWFIDRLEGSSVQYNIPAAFLIEGKLNIVAFNKSLITIVERHQVLRTRFIEEDGNVFQQVCKTRKPLLIQNDLSSKSEKQLQDYVQEQYKVESYREFNLNEGHLLRCTLLKLSDNKHVVLFNMHHIISDGWSIKVLIIELNQLYSDYSLGKNSTLVELPIQYGDYANWQQDWLKGKELSQQLEYWKTQLAELPLVHDLPMDKARPETQQFMGRCHSQVISSELTKQLYCLSNEQGVTLFMLLQSAFCVLLKRYSNQSDIVVGSPIAGRTHKDTESLIGCFVNTLVLRSNFECDHSFKDFLQINKKTILKAYANQNVPFEMLVETLKPERSLSHSPLYQIGFTFQSSNRNKFNFSGIDFTPIESNDKTTKFELNLTIINADGRLKVLWNYRTDLFNKEFINRMAESYKVLLDGILTNPESNINSLPILTIREKNHLVYELNNNKFNYPTRQLIHELFEMQAEQTPNNTAVDFEERKMTYLELNQAANRLAHYLLEQGVTTETLVGVCVERSLEMVVGILGILKAGGAYVPLDPDYPRARLELIQQDAQLEYLLIQSDLTDKFNITDDVQVTKINTVSFKETIANYPSVNPRRKKQGSESRLAYVLYTSGSTGKPKGVLQLHENVTRLFKATEVDFNFDQHDIWVLFHSIAFDFSVWELWGSLLYGAKLIIPNQETIKDTEKLVDLCLKHKVSILNQTPAAFHSFTQVTLQHKIRYPSLRFVIFGGEALNFDSLRSWWQQFSPTSPQLVNMYGITETTVHVTLKRISPVDLGCSVIGKALSDQRIYLLDSNSNLVPKGVIGEIHIGGAGLARGYLNQPELTKQQFIRNLFSDNTSDRLYKSGDLARYLSDGNLEFIGRVDEQVKIRGFRIETGEIESQILQNENVDACLVLALEDNLSLKRLVAYVVANKNKLSNANEIANEDLTLKSKKTLREKLRKQLKDNLPGFMQPAAFVILNDFPLTVNGKIDKKVLPIPDLISQKTEVYVSPKTQFEKELASIWCEILGVEEVGLNDNFFELGGHSLLVTQLVSRLRKIVEVELSIKDVFESATLNSLIKKIDNKKVEGKKTFSNYENRLPLVRYPKEEFTPLSIAQQRLWFLAQLDNESSAYNVPYALRLSGSLNLSALEVSFSEIIRRHESLRTVFNEVDGKPFQVIMHYSPVILNVDRIDEGELEYCIQQEAQQPFDLSVGPLFRIRLLQVNQDKHVLLLNLHHIITDGWSTGILVNELSHLYRANCESIESALSNLPVQYRDFSVWQKQNLQGDLLAQQVDYWRKQLDNLQPLSLPTDRPRGLQQNYQGSGELVDISEPITKALKNLGHQYGASLFMVLMAAFQLLLARYSRQSDIAVGFPIANRTESELEPMIGLFMNSLVLRSHISSNDAFLDLLEQVKTNTLNAYAHQDIPFEHLADVLKPERNMSQPTWFQVMLVLQNSPIKELQLKDLSVELIANKKVRSKLDMTLYLSETENQIHGTLEYSSELFDRKSIQRFIGCFNTLLESIVNEPASKICHLEILNNKAKSDLHKLSASTEYYTEKTELEKSALVNTVQPQLIHRIFERHAIEKKHHTAVSYMEQSISYVELNQQANQLAHYLIKRGVAPESLVALYFDRSIDMVIAILAVLKSGGAYIPIDSNYPTERISLMLESARPIFVLTQQDLSSQLAVSELPIIEIDSEYFSILKEGIGNPDLEIHPNQLAYVIYSSGSTGIPKGIAVTHSNLSSIYNAWRVSYDLDNIKSHLQMASYGFDVFTGDWVRALCSGARLVLCPRDILLEPEKLYNLLEKEAIECAEFVPAVVKVLINYLARHGLTIKCFKRVLVGSDNWQMQDIRKLQKLVSKKTIVVNSYGITEACIDSSYFVKSQLELSDDASVPIGKPFANTQFYILDEELQLVPAGVAGVLYVGGSGIARGYLNKADLTADKYIPNPFSDKGERLYRSDDLARYLNDGNIEFIGREDYQLKLRGLRIELGDIESQFYQHSSVETAVVKDWKDKSGEVKIVAYLKLNVDDEVVDWRQYMSNRLPDYMVPSSVTIMDKFPLTSNGKIDRGMLPEPKIEALQNLKYVAPSNDIEEKLCVIWQNTLHLKRVGVEDNFFDLGGHSLLAIQLISAIRKELNLELPLKTLFANPTIKLLILQMVEFQETTIRKTIVPLSEQSSSARLSFSQQRLWFIDQLENGSAHYNMCVAIQVDGSFSLLAAEESIRRIIKRHHSLRTNFEKRNEHPEQVLQTNFNFKLTNFDLSSSGNLQQEIDELVQADKEKVFDLRNDLMVRASFIDWSQKDQTHVGILLFNTHHIASDGWSTGILVNEFTQHYQDVVSGRPDQLPELELQYADYAHYQRQLMNTSLIKNQLIYWKKQFEEIPQVHSLMLDFPRPESKQYSGEIIRTQLSSTLNQKLELVANKSGLTLFMLFHAALALVLSRHSNSQDIVVGTPVAGRLQAEVEPLIGFFVNTLVLRTSTNYLDFDEYLKHVRQINLDAQENQDIPFEYLVEQINVNRSAQYTPLFQIMFTMDNTKKGEISIPGVKFTPLQAKQVTAKFDLDIRAQSGSNGTTISWTYDSSIFCREKIEIMSQHLTNLLTEISLRSTNKISELAILSDKETKYLLYRLNERLKSTSQDKLIHQLFEQKVELNPDSLALQYKDQQLSYRALNSASNQLARYLRAQCVEPGTLVGIYLERSLHTVVAMLAVLKSGGAYVPLDPGYPEARLNLILEDTELRHLLTQTNLSSALRLGNCVSVTELDNPSRQQELSAYSTDNLELTTSQQSDNVAYVIYTSGSTGRPKGIACKNESVINLIKDFQSNTPLTGHDNCAVWTSSCFDVSVYEVFSALCSGASLNIIPEVIRVNNQSLFPWLLEQNIQSVFLPAYCLAEFALWLKTNCRLELKRLLVGVEPILESTLIEIQRAVPGLQVINGYGPSEATVCSTLYFIDAEKKSPYSHFAPIGKAISNTRLYILNGQRQLVPFGAIGELYIAGDGLSLGYVNQPSLTNEKFIQNPFSDELTDRLYQTGDLVRYLPDGNLEFVGRVDEQVKIQGLRIEVKEIEHHLLAYHSVDSCVVVARKNRQGEKCLLAYIVLKKAATRSRVFNNTAENVVSVDEVIMDRNNDLEDSIEGEQEGEQEGELKEEKARICDELSAILSKHLRCFLPDYMVPSAFIVLSDLPLTPSGKVNKSKLPIPGGKTLNRLYVAPVTDIEKRLSLVWCKLLGLDVKQISATTSFFQLGGNSLLVVNLITQIKLLFEVEISIKEIFSNNSVRLIALLVEQAKAKIKATENLKNRNDILELEI